MTLLRTLLAGCLIAAIAVSIASAGGGRAPEARAVGYAALLPGGAQGAVSAATGGPAERGTSVTGLRPAGGGSVGSVRVGAGVATAGLEAEAHGTVTVADVSLLDGRVTIGSLRMSARASTGAGASGLTEGSVSGLSVDGAAVAAGPGSRVEVPGIGALVFMEQVSDGAGGVRANAIRLEVTDPHAATVIGQPFVLGHLDLSAAAGTAPVAPEPHKRPPAAPAAPARTAPGTATAPGATTTPAEPAAAAAAPIVTPAPLGLPRRAAPAVTIATDAGYVFPVVGDVSFTDDYGAPRAGTGWHHGNDLFAARGTPVVAVADGTLSRVGVNTLGGNRLWLTDDAGNAFYYAHLSAYAPAALEGARVTAGQVIAFVGNTGQAITTPPHLHFEVHPGGGDSVDPYPYLMAWRRGSDIPRAFAQAAATSPSPAPAVGAVLVDDAPELDAPPAPADGLASPAT